MAAIPVPKVIQICLRMLWASQNVEICFGLLKPTAISAGDLASMTTDMEAWRVAELVPQLSSDITFAAWYAVDLTTLTSPTLTTPITAATSGTASSPSVTNNTALTTTFYTDKRGRSYRGRVYTPGLEAAALNNSSEINTAQAIAMVAAYSAINSYLSLGFVHAVISRFNGGAARTTGVATPITLYGSDVLLDSQRRRLEGRGS